MRMDAMLDKKGRIRSCAFGTPNVATAPRALQALTNVKGMLRLSQGKDLHAVFSEHGKECAHIARGVAQRAAMLAAMSSRFRCGVEGSAVDMQPFHGLALGLLLALLMV